MTAVSGSVLLAENGVAIITAIIMSKAIAAGTRSHLMYAITAQIKSFATLTVTFTVQDMHSK